MVIAIVWHRFHSSIPLEGVCVIIPSTKNYIIDNNTGLPEGLVEHWFKYNFLTTKYDIMTMNEDEIKMANEELEELKITRGNTLYHNLLYNHKLPSFTVDVSKPVIGLNGCELPLGFKETKLNTNLTPMNKIAEVDYSEILNPQPPMMLLKKVRL
jgi:hypothetical protein